MTPPQPVAKAAYSYVDATLADGRYTMTVDDPFGLRCGDIYYGPTIRTHDDYTWNANTLAGQMVSTFDAGCDGAPGRHADLPVHPDQDVTMRAILAVTTVLALAVGATAAPASTDDDPVLHHVRYTVTANAPFYAHIYYRDTDPPTWSDYSYNPYEFSPRAEADLAPNKPWVFDAMLTDPDLWAMVLVQSGESPNTPTPGFNCELAVDGSVVKTSSGPKGVLCSIRNW